MASKKTKKKLHNWNSDHYAADAKEISAKIDKVIFDTEAAEVEFANAIGVRRQTIEAWRNTSPETSCPKTPYLIAIAETAGVSILELLPERLWGDNDPRWAKVGEDFHELPTNVQAQVLEDIEALIANRLRWNNKK